MAPCFLFFVALTRLNGRQYLKIPTILLTGFDIWPAVTYNSSWLAVSRSQPSCRSAIKKAMLPVSWKQAPTILTEQIDNDVIAVLAFGMAPSSNVVRMEQIAINQCDLNASDVDGWGPAYLQVRPGGPPSYVSTLPTESLVSSLNSDGIPAQISTYAGNFLCNFVFYTLMDKLAETGRTIPAGFVHLPPFHKEGGMAEAILVRTVEHLCTYVEDLQTIREERIDNREI